MVLRAAFIIALSFATSVPAWASEAANHFINTHEKGWFWDEDPPKPEPKRKNEKPEPKPKAIVKAEKQTPKKKEDPWELKPREDVIPPLKLLFENPRKNARNYIKWMKKLFDRSEEIVAAVKFELARDPTLLPQAIPSNSFAASMLKRAQAAVEQKAFEKNTGRFGFIVFMRDQCPMCEIQGKVLRLVKSRGYNVLVVTPDGLPVRGSFGLDVTYDGGMAQSLGIKGVPATIIVDNKTRKHFIVGTGVVPFFQLQGAVVDALDASGDLVMPSPTQPWDDKSPQQAKLRLSRFNPFKIYQKLYPEIVSSIQGNPDLRLELQKMANSIKRKDAFQ